MSAHRFESRLFPGLRFHNTEWTFPTHFSRAVLEMESRTSFILCTHSAAEPDLQRFGGKKSLKHLFICVYVLAPAHTHAEIRRQLAEDGSLIPPCGS